MEIAAITLIVIGLATAVVSILYLDASLQAPRGASCEEELETSVDDDWLWMYGEGYGGWIPSVPPCDIRNAPANLREGQIHQRIADLGKPQGSKG